MKSYATHARAEAALNDAGFAAERQPVMGSAPYRKGHAYAWIEHEWCRQHCAMRYFVNIRG